MIIKQESLDEKSTNSSSFLRSVASLKWDFNLKQHQMIWAKNSARELRVRESKQITSKNTMNTGDLFYRGSALEGLVPVEESTKDGSLSTLSLSPPITKDRRAFLLKDHLRLRKDHHTLWCLLLALQASKTLEEVQWESKLHAQMNTRMKHTLSLNVSHKALGLNSIE